MKKVSPTKRLSAVAAVANDDKGEDAEPHPVVVKQVAQAVAVHSNSSLKDLQAGTGASGLTSCYHFMSEERECSAFAVENRGMERRGLY